jgi:hypothetical protein
MDSALVADGIRKKFERLRASMNERVCRHWAAAEAMALPHGGITLVALATGMSRTRIRTGIAELKAQDNSSPALPPSRSRRPGGGGKPIEQTDPELLPALEALVAPETRGDPMSPLRWTEWQRKGRPEEVRVYDFIDKAPDKGRVTPYGVYDLTANEGWVSVGTDHDTARFAAQTIEKWWREMGCVRYPDATE